eukprot:9432661-Alexandrium_andersonii.AAC.1
MTHVPPWHCRPSTMISQTSTNSSTCCPAQKPSSLIRSAPRRTSALRWRVGPRPNAWWKKRASH